ncbi:hypothetical protein FRB99_000621, partial [Tulasnella sp. 403]
MAPPDYSKMKVPELMALARERKLKGRSGLTKQKLIDILRKDDMEQEARRNRSNQTTLVPVPVPGAPTLPALPVVIQTPTTVPEVHHEGVDHNTATSPTLIPNKRPCADDSMPSSETKTRRLLPLAETQTRLATPLKSPAATTSSTATPTPTLPITHARACIKAPIAPYVQLQPISRTRSKSPALVHPLVPTPSRASSDVTQNGPLSKGTAVTVPKTGLSILPSKRPFKPPKILPKPVQPRVQTRPIVDLQHNSTVAVGLFEIDYPTDALPISLGASQRNVTCLA